MRSASEEEQQNQETVHVNTSLPKFPKLSLTLKVGLNVPGVVGVPCNNPPLAPSDANVSPGGRPVAEKVG